MSTIITNCAELLFSLFRLLSDIGSAIICVVSRKAILGTLIFDTGGSRKIAVTGLESWKVGEFFSRKERKGSQRLETRNPKLTNRQAKPFAAVAQCTAKKEPGNPDKDLGTSSVAHKERRRATYAILRIWL